MAGDKKAISYVVEHCIADVQALDEVFKRIRPFIMETENPKLHTCEKKHLRSHGIRVANTRTYRRYFCVKCGGWFRGEIVKDSNE